MKSFIGWAIVVIVFALATVGFWYMGVVIDAFERMS
jgi:hypothetical protein